MKHLLDERRPMFFYGSALMENLSFNLNDLIKHLIKAPDDVSNLRFRQYICKDFPDHKIYDPYHIKSVQRSLKKYVSKVDLINMFNSIVSKIKNENQFNDIGIKIDSNLVEDFFGKICFENGFLNILQNEFEDLYQTDYFRNINTLPKFYDNHSRK